MQKKAIIIVNPVAGTMKVKQALWAILASLGGQGYETTVFMTQKQGDASEVAGRHGADSDLVVCCGGDGTLNEVIHGILPLAERPLLLYYPCGSTNDFATTLGLSSDVRLAIANVEERQVMDLDVGQLNETMNFSYIASFGAFVRASYAAPRAMKNAMGHFAYILEGIKELPSIGKCYHTKITHDGGVIEGEFALVAVTNSTSAGGVLRLPAEQVKLNDGLFEIFLIKGIKNAADATSAVQMLLSKKYDGDKVTLLHTTKAVIECEEAPDWCVDGEYAGKIAHAEVTCLQGAVRILI
ncbi:MAG: YegS/Rv2252/BmrU family lipid kinase [Ruminococcaceae bacterium]|nr:YegS/Rv2252/BmrU family lipid kinase [Oscillospiraceae bacterium]